MSWIDDVVAVYGEPQVQPSTPAGIPLEGDEGRYRRRAYVWFPAATNHHVSIDTYTRREFDGGRPEYAYYVVRAGSHRRGMGSVEWRGRTEPDDESMRKLLDLIGFLTTVPAVSA